MLLLVLLLLAPALHAQSVTIQVDAAKSLGPLRPIERVFGFKFLPQDVYQISDLPSELRAMDVIMTAVVSFSLSALATIYPSWRASKVNPAEALRYE